MQHRPNLTVLTDVPVPRILLDGHRASGVELLHRGTRRTIHAAREIVLSAGAIHSPQLLMLSGIGDREALQTFGIEARHHRPGIGAGLQNRIDIYLQYRCRRPVTLNGKTGPVSRLLAGADEQPSQRGGRRHGGEGIRHYGRSRSVAA